MDFGLDALQLFSRGWVIKLLEGCSSEDNTHQPNGVSSGLFIYLFFVFEHIYVWIDIQKAVTTCMRWAPSGNCVPGCLW